MKISKETLDTLKSLATINLNILLKEGSKLTTKSPANTIVAEMEIPEKFEQEFGIYDLSRFLGVVSLYDDPDFEFDDKKVVISEGKNTTVYYGAEAEILTYPEKQVKFPGADIEFNVENTDVVKALKAASVLGCNMFTFEGDGSKIYIVVSDPSVQGSNKFKLEVGETDKEFKAHIKIENMKLLACDYTVAINKKKIVQLTANDDKIKYLIALDSSSTFE